MRRVIVSASDDNYLPVAKGLWLSLRDVDWDLGFVDFGSSSQTRRWLAENISRVSIRGIPGAVADLANRVKRSSYQAALILRPWLPEIFPEYDEILWIDADAWLQDANTLEVFARAMKEKPQSVAITPVIDSAYSPLFNAPTHFVEMHVGQVFDAFYPEDASKARLRPLLSCGAFAMRSDCPLWSLWAQEVQRVYEEEWPVVPEVFHVADQTAFNQLAYENGLVAPLDARHSFIACLGELIRDEEGVVVTAGPESRTIGIIQLAGISDPDTLDSYLRNGLFFEHGNYLSPDEVIALRSLRRS